MLWRSRQTILLLLWRILSSSPGCLASSRARQQTSLHGDATRVRACLVFLLAPLGHDPASSHRRILRAAARELFFRNGGIGELGSRFQAGQIRDDAQ